MDTQTLLALLLVLAAVAYVVRRGWRTLRGSRARSPADGPGCGPNCGH